ncbi:MAG: carbohydrate ABC transporter permease [Oscillospiraceae bacterium]|nr:carbohydrate ABC transporter permease [Oscillospiraceae bacterium]
MIKSKKTKAPKRKRYRLVTALLTVIAAVSAAIFLLPTVLTIANSFMSASEINANYGAIFATTEKGGKVFVSEKINLKFIPDMVSFSQYFTVLFKSPDYLLKFWNSVILVVPIVIFQLATASLAAYAFARLKGRLKEIIFFVYIIVMLMPYQVTLVPNYLVSDWLGILDTRLAIILPGIFTPFAVFILSKIMRRIPPALIEAAKLDGAGELQIFTYICMPLCKSALFSVAILVFIDYWNMVEQPLILLSDTNLYPLSVFLSRINTGEIGLAFAVATIYMIPALLLFLYGEDYLVEGIAYSGGIKG